jgi:CHAT domain-containing protein/tetratricopeptide (TPR) repeat protein
MIGCASLIGGRDEGDQPMHKDVYNAHNISFLRMFQGATAAAHHLQRRNRRTSRSKFRLSRRLWLIYLFAIVEVATALLILGGCERDPRKGEHRPGEGRLSQLPWTRYEPTSERQANRALLREKDRARAALAASRTSETLRRDALVSLASGDADRAIAELTEAIDLAPGDASLWSDLASARLQRGDDLADPAEFVLALAAAHRAVTIAPSLLAARFNRGLAFERLSLRRAAVADWRIVATRENDSGWAREAQAHAEAAVRPLARVDWDRSLASCREAVRRGDAKRARSLVRGSPQRFREHVMEEGLPTWATRTGATTEESLALTRAVGQALAANDRMIVETVEQIDRLRATDPDRLRQLRQALRMYGDGIALARQESFTQAFSRFDESREALSSLKSPLAGWAAFQAAYCRNRMFDLPKARAMLMEIERAPGTARFKALHGRTLWVLALIDAVEGDLTTSLTHLGSALADFEALGEKDNLARLQAFMAVNFDYLGKRDDAWREIYSALEEVESLDRSQAQRVVWQAAASLAYEQGELGVAQAFMDELLRITKATDQASAVVEALRWRAVILARLGQTADAAADLKEAWVYQQHISDPDSRRSLEGDLRLAEGELAVDAAPERALTALDPAIRIFRSSGYHYQLGHALYLRSLAEDRLGRFDDEERDLAAALAESERQREKVTTPEQRISYLDRRRELFDSMISFQLDRRRRSAVALGFSEKAKARVLWDWILTHPGGGLHQDLDQSRLSLPEQGELESDLPGGTAIVEYAVLPQRTIIWLLRREMEPEVFTVEIGAEEIGDLVQDLHHAVAGGKAAALEKASETLYDALLDPVVRHLAGGERLVFVPDGALHALPFVMLQDRRTKRYLIQDHICSVAPSIRVFQASLRRDRSLVREGAPRTLMIADPDFDRSLYPSLVRLSAWETEAAVATIFPDSRVLRDRFATTPAFLDLAGGFEIVHFGGHSVVNVEFPLLSQMVFAKSPGHSGVLYSGDILKQQFPRTRLVVLASCATGAGRISRTEGVESLARPFLAAGVPAVVASLWRVQDAATSDLFARFYQHLHRCFDAAAALRDAQVEAIERGDKVSRNPQVWGAFAVIGGSPPPG